MTGPLPVLTPIATALIERWQRGFPLATRPYASLARAHDIAEAEVLDILGRLIESGVVSRVGATLRPNTAGASLLAAMRVPPHRLEEVAAIVNGEQGVNHNYEREHAYNLWFVVTGGSRDDLDISLARIRGLTGLGVLELPLERSYYIDLGFPIASGPSEKKPMREPAASVAAPLDDVDRRILSSIEHGLPLVPRPYAKIAEAARASEAGVISCLARLCETGVITRLGLIVRHRMLGISSNAMAVWDIADSDVDRVGALLARQPCVTLCYRRPRCLPDWPYNLFCMVHGRERATVLAEIEALTTLANLRGRRHTVLFSRRCFRQRGPTLRPTPGVHADA